MSEEPVDQQPAETQPRHAITMPAWIGVVLAVVVVLLVVGTAYALGANRGTDDEAAVAPAAATGDAAQGMVVSGTGTATGVPDQLRFTVTVHHSAADVTDAMNATSGDTRRVVRALTAQGVAKGDIRTAGVSVQPNYRYSGGQEVITGYAATERVAVKVRELKIAGKVISAAANAAGNAVRISGLTMSVADPSAILAKARAQAVADARTKAEQFAAAAGRKLGEVVVVEESEPQSDYPELQQRELNGFISDTPAAKVPINPGTETTKVYVRVRWSFA